MLDIGDVLIFLGMLSFQGFYEEWLWSAFPYAFETLLVYQIGKYFVTPCCGNLNSSNTDDQVRPVVFVVLTLAVVLFVRGLLNFSYFLSNPIEGDIEGWEGWGTWSGDSTPRTQHEFYLVLIGSLLVIWLFFIIKEKRYVLGLLGLTASCAAIAMGLAVQGRMTFFCSAGAVASVIVLLFFERKLYLNRYTRIAGILLVLLAISTPALFHNNVAGLGELYESSGMSGSGGILHNVRFDMFRQSIRLLKDYPWGRCAIPLFEYGVRPNDYAHNSWLDIGRRGGIIPLVLTIAFTITNIYALIRAWIKKADQGIYVLVAGFVGITLYNSFEPGIMGDYAIWNTEVFLGGLAYGLYASTSGRYGLVINLRDNDKQQE